MGMRPVGLFLVGGLGGAAVGTLIWMYASRKLDQQLAQGGSELASALGTGRSELQARLSAGEAQLQQQIRTAVQREVPPTVRSTLETTLREYGLTPETGRQMSSILAAADRMGII